MATAESVKKAWDDYCEKDRDLNDLWEQLHGMEAMRDHIMHEMMVKINELNAKITKAKTIMIAASDVYETEKEEFEKFN